MPSTGCMLCSMLDLKIVFTENYYIIEKRRTVENCSYQRNAESAKGTFSFGRSIHRRYKVCSLQLNGQMNFLNELGTFYLSVYFLAVRVRHAAHHLLSFAGPSAQLRMACRHDWSTAG